MPDRVSYLKARYCRAILKTALNSRDDDARRLIYCLATEKPTISASPEISSAEHAALAELTKLARRIDERGVAALATHWRETNDAIERWIDVANQDDVLSQ